MGPHQAGAVSGSRKEGNKMEKDAEQERDVNQIGRSQGNNRESLSQVVVRMSEGRTHDNYEEEMEGEMYDVTRRLFTEEDTSNKVQ